MGGAAAGVPDSVRRRSQAAQAAQAAQTRRRTVARACHVRTSLRAASKSRAVRAMSISSAASSPARAYRVTVAIGTPHVVILGARSFAQERLKKIRSRPFSTSPPIAPSLRSLLFFSALKRSLLSTTSLLHGVRAMRLSAIHARCLKSPFFACPLPRPASLSASRSSRSPTRALSAFPCSSVRVRPAHSRNGCATEMSLGII